MENKWDNYEDFVIRRLFSSSELSDSSFVEISISGVGLEHPAISEDDLVNVLDQLENQKIVRFYELRERGVNDDYGWVAKFDIAVNRKELAKANDRVRLPDIFRNGMPLAYKTKKFDRKSSYSKIDFNPKTGTIIQGAFVYEPPDDRYRELLKVLWPKKEIKTPKNRVIKLADLIPMATVISEMDLDKMLSEERLINIIDTFNQTIKTKKISAKITRRNGIALRIKENEQ